MTREEIVKINRLVASGGLTENEIHSLLMNYCLEHEKDYIKTALFIVTILQQVIWQYFFEYALEYYNRKFTINKLYNKQGILISIY